MDTKTCTICKIEKPISEFNKRSSIKEPGKTKSACKACCSKASKEYRNRPNVKAYFKNKRKEDYMKQMADPIKREKVRKANQQREQRPEVQTKRKAYWLSDKAKKMCAAKQARYRADPDQHEKIKKYHKEYAKTPQCKAQLKRYLSKEENLAKSDKIFT